MSSRRFVPRDLARGYGDNTLFIDTELELGNQSGESSPQSIWYSLRLYTPFYRITDSPMKRKIKWTLFALWLIITIVALFSTVDFVQDVQAAIGDLPVMKSWVGRALRRCLDWHGSWFLVLAGLAALLPLRMTGKTALILLGGLSLFSLYSELIQGVLIPKRSFQWWDVIHNEVGIAVGLGIVVCMRFFWGRIGREGVGIRAEN